MDPAMVTAIAVLLVSVTGAWVAWNQRQTRAEVKQVRAIAVETHAQVVTLNESSVGELAAEDETRRVESIPHDDRTEKEQRHLDEAPPSDPAQGPVRIADRLAHVEQVSAETHDRVEEVHHAVNGAPGPPLYELVQGLVVRFDDYSKRLDRLEASIGLPSSRTETL